MTASKGWSSRKCKRAGLSEVKSCNNDAWSDVAGKRVSPRAATVPVVPMASTESKRPTKPFAGAPACLEIFVSEFDLTRRRLNPLGFWAFSHAPDQGKIPREANDATNPANPATRSSSSNAPKRENIGRPQSATAQREAFENDEDTTGKEGRLSRGCSIVLSQAPAPQFMLRSMDATFV